MYMFWHSRKTQLYRPDYLIDLLPGPVLDRYTLVCSLRCIIECHLERVYQPTQNWHVGQVDASYICTYVRMAIRYQIAEVVHGNCVHKILQPISERMPGLCGILFFCYFCKKYREECGEFYNIVFKMWRHKWAAVNVKFRMLITEIESKFFNNTFQPTRFEYLLKYFVHIWNLSHSF